MHKKNAVMSVPSDVIRIIVKFKSFLENYKSIEGEFIYAREILKNEFSMKSSFLKINILHLLEFDFFLFFKLIKAPGKTICIFDYVIKKILQYNEKISNKFFSRREMKILLLNTDKNFLERRNFLNPINSNKLIITRMYVVKYGHLIPEMTNGLFKCQNCYFELYSFLECGKIIEPTYCFYCKIFNSFCLVYNRCNYIQRKFIQTYQIFKKIEVFNLIHEQNNYFSNCFYGLNLGTFIEITGIFRIAFLKNFHKFYQNSSFKFFIDVFSIVKCKFFNFKLCSCDFELFKHFSRKKIVCVKKIGLYSLVQNFYLYVFFVDNSNFSFQGFDVVRYILLLRIFFSKVYSTLDFKKYFKIFLVKHIDVNEKFSQVIKNYSFEKNSFYMHYISKYYMLNKPIAFFSIPVHRKNKFIFYLYKKFTTYTSYSYDTSHFSFMNFYKNFFLHEIQEFKFQNIQHFFIIINIKKKSQKFVKKITFSFLFNLYLENFVIFFANLIDIIYLSQKIFKYHLCFFNWRVNKHFFRKSKRFNIGFNKKNISVFSDYLSKLKFSYCSDFLYNSCLKWQFIIKKEKIFKKTINCLFSNSFSMSIFQLSKANARIKCGNFITPIDIRISFILLLESIKSLIKKNN
ncbi:minichromosome maintenance complex component 4-like protein (nucleomorph) [Cryptomonas paramecium]|uniref:Minichromosome maintenance complex component 4-like protein n=1 Tax=Cryptomonas paramaecium TaxID=2898 RepID=F2HH77_9CRYP|nr:minichromosome maintenance complex component 4-like protein [Cryptomonas paramecium]AEA38673.1 minichromosome maintenance complex component 4-like protein [Cryptomonas paramecium]|mmetsp:Transcript_52766/g.138824  ORF Transcript_52766/g.138824 Transcript_52766/m.138824 type:complete len:627 (-) Transcript_52766:2054-3934(-)